MAKTTILTDLNGVGLGPLLGADATTPAARNASAVLKSVTAESTNPVGWTGVATQADGEVGTAAGALTPLTVVGGTAAMPIVVIGGKDYAASPIGRGLRCDENGNLYTAGYGNAAAGLPLTLASAGGVSSAVNAETTIVSAAGATYFQYLTFFDFMCTTASTADPVITVKVGTANPAGTTLLIFKTGVAVNAVGTRYLLGPFPVPYKTTALNQLVTVTIAASGGAWWTNINGYKSTL